MSNGCSSPPLKPGDIVIMDNLASHKGLVNCLVDELLLLGLALVPLPGRHLARRAARVAAVLVDHGTVDRARTGHRGC